MDPVPPIPELAATHDPTGEPSTTPFRNWTTLSQSWKPGNGEVRRRSNGMSFDSCPRQTQGVSGCHDRESAKRISAKTYDFLATATATGAVRTFSAELARGKPSVTITVGRTTLSKGKFRHPEGDRSTSLSDAALLQILPPDHRFETPFFERTCEIIGNLLPSAFAEIVAR